MRAAVVLVLLAACGGGGDARPDGGLDDGWSDGPNIDANPGPGTWDNPIVIDQLPFTATGDTRGFPNVTAAYLCGDNVAQNGPEVVYALAFAGRKVITAALSDIETGADVDVDVVAWPADHCVQHDDQALVAEVEGGVHRIVVDTPGTPGRYTLTVTEAVSTSCLQNPIPACQDGDAPNVNQFTFQEPPGLGGCPAGMALAGTACIDRWEAALVLDQGAWSPYLNPGALPVRAVSAPGLVPQGYVNGVQAAAACERAGKRLCTDAEWLRACQGPAGLTYPYGNQRVPGQCNDARTCHPAVQYFESSDSSVFGMIDNSCLNQLPDGLVHTGDLDGCVSPDGIYDLMGNLHEWTADPAGTFRGGFYVDTTINGNGCLYRTTAHDTSHWDYSTGFRCCADAP